jgi:hypothetical protein
MIDPSLYDRARDHIAATGFTSDLQTRITLILCAAKTGNLAFHSTMQWLPNLGVIEQFVISQAARELEAVTLLTRTTQWSPNPALALEANRIAAPLTSAWTRILMAPGPLLDPTAVYRGLSLGHAQLARIRLLPVIPDEANPPTASPHPFVVALHRIEQENGRMLQTQIRLLKNVGEDIPLDERERLIEDDQQLVDGVFGEFLAWLAA